MLAARFINSLMKRSSYSFILAFHTLPAGHFHRIIESLEGFTPVPLADLVNRNKSGKSAAGIFAITVDDGEGDNVRALAPLLQKKGWPATFYVPTAYLDSASAMPFQWWRNIAPLLPHQPFVVGNEVFDGSRPRNIQRLSRELERLWRTQKPERYMPLLEELITTVERTRGICRSEFQPPAPIRWDEVRRLSRSGPISFESHGTAHTAVTCMTEEELVIEMKASRDRIAEQTGLPCRHFCYPFGSPESIGDIAPRVAREYYDSAVTMTLGGARGADPWLLPRIPVYEETSSAMVRLKIGLKCNKAGSIIWCEKGESAVFQRTRPEAPSSSVQVL